MRSLSMRMLIALSILLVPTFAFASVTINGTTSFASLDGGPDDADHTVNGVFTVNGDLIVNGTINCNDTGGSSSACPMSFNVSGDMTINAGGALYAEDRTGSGTGGAITISTGGNFVMHSASGSLAAAIISSDAKSSSASNGGAITVSVTGTLSIESGATIDAGAINAAGGKVTLLAGGHLDVSGNVFSGPSRTLLSTARTGQALDGGTSNQSGGEIYIQGTSYSEPGVTIGSNANIISQGQTNGAGPVTIEGCGVVVKGLVAALAFKDYNARVDIRSGKSVTIDARDLGVANATLGRNGQIRVDAPTGAADHHTLDIYAGTAITINGPDPAASSLFALSGLPGVNTSKSDGAAIHIMAVGGPVLTGTVTGSGNLIEDGRVTSGDGGGHVEISAQGDIGLDTARILAIGDSNTNNTNRNGGFITIRSYSGNVVWTNGVGDVTPTGSNVPSAQRGNISITACGTINTSGSTFPTNGSPVGPFPVTTTGTCSPATPSLPNTEPALPVCNNPPVADNSSATTNEDNAVTITMTASDPDGDSLTFTIVTPPAHGTLSAIFNPTPTSAQVTYTPNANYNGSDSFTFKADDGKGGTSIGTVTITVNPVNDPPTFNLGANPVTSNEDAGAQSIANYASMISPGPTADEASQTVTFTVTNDNNALFSVQPAISSSGTLTYTSAPNANGSANVTVVAHDNGGTANGGNDTSVSHVFNIVINAVNDAPSFTKGADQTVLEDSGPHTVSGWATGISAGPADESSQTVTFTVTNDNNALFSAQPAVASNGTLTFTTAANANGSATVTVVAHDDGGTANGGVDTSAPQTFTITVTAVNDAPSFTKGADVTVLEDSGAYTQSGWATAISAGPADESGQTVHFNVTGNSNSAMFSVQPAIANDGTLTFTPAADANGTATITITAQDDGGTANGGVDTSAAQTFVINVTAVNDAPSFTKGADQTALEDAGPQTVAGWATAISAGPANESSQTVTFTVTNSNNALFSSQPAVASNGTLTYTTAPNANGSATVTVTAHDDGGTANGGVDTSAPQTFTITITAVNDAPSFTSGGNVTVNEDSGAYSAAWATGISAGPADESGQTVTFHVSNDNNALFSSQPSISPSGVLSFTTAPDAFGTATVTVTLQDNGGTANGGNDTSAAQTFTITVNAVNDAPSFTPGGNVSTGDNAAYSAPWASSISAGPANESGQTVAFHVSNDNNSLFSVQPAISPSGVLTFTPIANHAGTATVSVYLQDNGGTANGGVDTSSTVTFTITITHVNVPPVANDDSYETIGNTQLEVSASHTTTTSVFVSGSLLANDTDSDGPSPLTATLVSSTAGATVTVNSDGTFTYTPPAGFTGTDTFTYSVSDGAASSTATVHILVKSRVWYVKNDAPALGSGRSIDPFTQLSSAQSSATAGDTIYVFTGDGTTAGQNSGIVLSQTNERLIGEGVALTVNVSVNGNPAPTTLRAAGTAPQIGNPSGDGVFSTNTSGIEVQGISASGTPNAIHVTTTAAGSGSATIANNIVSAATSEGVKIAGGGTGTLTVALTNNIVTSTGNAIDASSTAGALHLSVDGNSVTSLSSNGIAVSGAGTTITSFASNNVSGNTALDGVTMSGGVVFDTVPGAPLTAVSGGSSNIGTLGNPVGRNGVVLAGVVGDLSYTSLNIYAGNGSGLLVTGGGQFNGTTGTEVDAAAGSITATAGPAISMSNATAGLNLSSTSSSSSVSTGISLTNVNGTVSGGTGLITGSSGVGVDITAGTANVTYDGNVATTSARPVQIQNTTAGLKSFGGSITGSGQGIFLNANTGATIAFSGAITLSSGTNDAFTATAGGTVTATGNGSILTTTTGTAVKVQNTTIGAAGLKFRSVSSNGGTNGILLTNTGNAGGINVTGNGVAGSGGTIQNTANAVSLSSTSNVQLAYMNLQNNSTAAINGTSVAGGTLDHVVVNGTNGTLTDAAVEFTGLTGAFNVTNSNISGGMTDNFRILNNAGETLNRLTVTGTTFGLNSTANGNDSLILQGTNGTMNVTIQNSTFTGAAGDIFQMDLHGTVSSDLVFTGNAVSNNHPAVISGGGGITLASGGPSDNPTFTYNISNNTFSGANGAALGISKGSGTGTFSGTINANTFGISGVPNSGSIAGSDIIVGLIGGGSTTVHITNNQLFQYNNNAIGLQIGSNASGGIGGMNATITGNTISQPGTGGASMNGINLNAGTSSGDANFVCLSIGGAGALANSFTGSGANGATDFRLRQRMATTVRLPGYAGANNDTAAVISFVQSQNGGTPTGSVTVSVPTGGGFVGGAACP